MAFSPDGRLLATGWSRHVRLTDLVSGEELGRFAGHERNVACMAFSPDGRRLCSGSEDTTVLVWDMGAITKKARPQAESLQSKGLESLWSALAGDDATKAYQAILKLVADPKTSVPFLGKHLKPAAPPDSKRIAQLIADLDDKQFVLREKAVAQLKKLGEPAVPALRKALGSKPPLELRR